MKKQNTTQKVSVAFAYIFYVLALASIGAVIYFYQQHGGNHPAVAAWAAAIVFFVGGGIVLHVMGRADIPDFRIK
ncbi:hemerythrin family protein [Thiolapillus sp.]